VIPELSDANVEADSKGEGSSENGGDEDAYKKSRP
jgi:hypothetical protein